MKDISYNEIALMLAERGYAISEEVRFFLGRLTECLEAQNQSTDISEILKWLEKRRKEYVVEAEEINIEDIEKWKFDHGEGKISHESGKFFSVIGVKVQGA